MQKTIHIMYSKSILLLIISLIMFIISLILNLMNTKFTIEWMIMNYNSIELELSFLIDWMSTMFISLVSMISSMIYIYSKFYMEMEKYWNRFSYLLLLFILSMILMILSPNIFSIMIGWDGLGLISYCLVIYYQSMSSYKSGMITIMCNRMGDVGMLFAIPMTFILGSSNILLYNYNLKFLIFCIIIASISKSAQLPFSIWLPAAMAAPTPISALVHSSTLVTAGVYLLIRNSNMLILSNYNKHLFYISLLTCIMSSMMAMYEMDLKKIIALSTLSQISIMMMTLSLNLKLLSFFHLLTHALFKSLLFMCAGLIIHSNLNNQDIRFFGNLKNYPVTSLMFMFASLSLSGFPFTAGFYSKDLILENSFFLSNNSINILMMISTLLTMAYNTRLMYYLFLSNNNYNSMNFNYENKFMYMSMIPLFIMSICSGSMFNLLFFLNYNISYSSYFMKLMILLSLQMGLLTSMFFIFQNIFNMEKKTKFFLPHFFSSMFNLNILYNIIYMPFFNYSKKNLKYIEKGWINQSISMYFMNLFLMKWKKSFMLINSISILMFFIFFIIIMDNL